MRARGGFEALYRDFVVRACLALWLSVVGSDAVAASPSNTATGNMPLVGLADDSATSTQVNPFYYTQIFVDAVGFAVPASDDAKKDLGKALLAALNLKKETKSVVVTLSISAEGISYPEIPVLSYQFDGSRKLTNVVLMQRKTLPLQRLPANSHYDITLKYRYSDQNQFDARSTADAIAGLVPTTTLANVITKPFFQGVSGLVSRMFSLAGSTDTSFSISDEMSPFQGGHNRLVAMLRRPNQTEFGTITMSLAATPLIGRTAQTDLAALANADFRKLPFEDPSTFSMMIGGTRRALLSEAKSLTDYSRLADDKSPASLSAYCNAAMAKLDQELNLSPMERVLVVHQSLLDARFAPNQSDWYFACFNDADLAWLKTALDINPTRPVDVATISGLPLTNPIKYALGCLITNQTGQNCSAQASDPKAVLVNAFDSKVVIGQMELPNVANLSNLPADRKIDRAALIDALQGKAARFGCFPRGLLLQNEQGSKAFQIRATVVDSKIVRLDIATIPASEFSCTS